VSAVEFKTYGWEGVVQINAKAAPTARPNGKLYRPRRLPDAHVMAQEDDWPNGAVCLRTHDVEVAKVLAREACTAYDNEIGDDGDTLERFEAAGEPRLAWWTREIGGYTEGDGLPTYWVNDPSGLKGIPVVVWGWAVHD
jgi:hypothetical protein